MDGETADAIVTDPPYGIAYRSNHDGCVPRSIKGDEDTTARDSILLGVEPDFPVACFASWKCKPPRNVRGELIWKKNVGGMGDLTFPWSLNYEIVWIFGKGWKGHRGSSILEGETIVTWNTGSAARVHPHQKPVDVLAELIQKSPGSVFDPFLGSGTTLIAAEQLDHRGWVVDYGKGGFGPIREWLHATFDHTLLISEDDPDRDVFLQLETLGLAQTRLVPGTSCERLSQYVLEHAEALIRKATSGRCWVQSVECFEHGANSAIYENPSALLSKIDLEVYTRLAADVSANDRHLDQAGDSTRVK